MSIQLKVPSLGESVTQATVGTWLKQEGDPVQADEPIVEVESEKATVALPAPAAGVLRRVLRKSGETVNVGEVLGEIEEGAAAPADAASPYGSGPIPGGPMPAARSNGKPASSSSPPTPTPTPTPTQAQAQAQAPTSAQSSAPAQTSSPSSTSPTVHAEPFGDAAGGLRGDADASARSRGPRRLSPSARRLAAEHGVPLDTLGQGAVRKDDVLHALEAPLDSGPAEQALRSGRAEAPRPAPAPAPAPARDGGPVGARERAVPMTPLRRTVARRLVEAQRNAAILTTFNEVDMTRVLALRDEQGERFLARHGVKLGFMSFFVKAAIEGLRAFPAVNAEIRGETVVYKDHYDIGVAVGGGKGLVVPVVRDADARSFADVEKTIGELAKKAKENRITMDELAGGTFTISNGGIYGSLLSTPILNPPQSGILGLHKIEKRAVVGDGDQIVVRPMMYLALSYDHRLVDGREAVSFLVKVKECIEAPERILLEV
jgi:2-oxoglutarate dehydrogenase E2 component (dihydrolipoamide succinyltransferase)